MGVKTGLKTSRMSQSTIPACAEAARKSFRCCAYKSVSLPRVRPPYRHVWTVRSVTSAARSYQRSRPTAFAAALLTPLLAVRVRCVALPVVLTRFFIGLWVKSVALADLLGYGSTVRFPRCLPAEPT